MGRRERRHARRSRRGGLFTGRLPARARAQRAAAERRHRPRSSTARSTARSSACRRSRSIRTTRTTTGIGRSPRSRCSRPTLKSPAVDAGDGRLHDAARADAASSSTSRASTSRARRDHHPRRELERQRGARAGRTRRSTRSTTYTNEGRSEYKALVFSLNGTLRGRPRRHGLVHGRGQEEHQRRLQPGVPDGLPERSGEHRGRVRPRRGARARPLRGLAASFRMPWQHHGRADLRVRLRPALDAAARLRLQRRRQDSATACRASAASRQDGPRFSSVNLRVAKAVPLSAGSASTSSPRSSTCSTGELRRDRIDNGQFLSGPTLANPAAAVSRIPNYGNCTRATLPSREVQLGVRVSF